MLMKNIYKMLYTIDNLNKQEDDFFEIDTLLNEKKLSDINLFFDLIEQEPSQKVVEKILAFAYKR